MSASGTYECLCKKVGYREKERERDREQIREIAILGFV
jgi:hypothetical protein